MKVIGLLGKSNGIEESGRNRIDVISDRPEIHEGTRGKRIGGLISIGDLHLPSSAHHHHEIQERTDAHPLP
jgi:hypothetical protein